MRQRPKSTRRRRALAGVAAMGVLVLLLAACTGDEGAERTADSPGGGSTAGAGDAPAPEEGQAPDAANGEAPEADGGAEDPGATPLAVGDLEAGDETRMLVREGRITVAYPVSFDEASREVSSIVASLGGGVTGIESSTDDDGVTRGTVVVEVPVGRFDDLLAQVGDVGHVLHRDITTEDLTEEHVDLESRLRHLERQEAFYLELFDEADGVEDALSIQRHLEQVQQRTEQIQGRLDQIERTSARSTLAIELVPEGDEPGATARAGVGFGAYWDDAVAAFVSVAGTLLVIVVGAAPLMLAGGLVVAAVLLAVRLWRRPAVSP